MRCKGELSAAAIDRGWPHPVMLPARLCERGGYNEIHEFCRDPDALLSRTCAPSRRLRSWSLSPPRAEAPDALCDHAPVAVVAATRLRVVHQRPGIVAVAGTLPAAEAADKPLALAPRSQLLAERGHCIPCIYQKIKLMVEPGVVLGPPSSAPPA
jgi:hypothetical protein